MACYNQDEKIIFEIDWDVSEAVDGLLIDLTLKDQIGTPIGYCDCWEMRKSYTVGHYLTKLCFDISNLAGGAYVAFIHISAVNDVNNLHDLDQSCPINFDIISSKSLVQWKREFWGSVKLNKLYEI